jgi:hypothetical protein
MLLFKSDYLEIYYFKAESLVESRWIGFPTSAEYRKGLISYLNIITHYEVKYWLEDYHLVTGIHKCDKEWSQKVWAPKFSKIACTKIERMARVITAKRYKEVNLKNIAQTSVAAPFPVLYQEFQNHDLALCWLTGKFFLLNESLGIAV